MSNTKKERITMQNIVTSLNAVANLQEGGRANGHPQTYTKDFGWSKPSSIEGMNWRDHMFTLAVTWFGTKDISVWSKANNDSMTDFAKIFSAIQGNTHYSRPAVRQQINYAYQALQRKATGSIETTLEAHAAAVRLGLYTPK